VQLGGCRDSHCGRGPGVTLTVHCLACTTRITNLSGLRFQEDSSLVMPSPCLLCNSAGKIDDEKARIVAGRALAWGSAPVAFAWAPTAVKRTPPITSPELSCL